MDALRRAGYDVDYIAEMAPGAADPDVLERANRGSSVLITGDKGFGELAYRRRQQNSGVVLLRLSGLTQQRKVEIAVKVFADRAADFAGALGFLLGKVRRPTEQTVCAGALGLVEAYHDPAADRFGRRLQPEVHVPLHVDDDVPHRLFEQFPGGFGRLHIAPRLTARAAVKGIEVERCHYVKNAFGDFLHG